MAPLGGGAKSGGALPKLCILCPKTAFFGPKRPQNPVITAKRRETVATLHVRLDCPLTKNYLPPSSSTICPRNGPKMAKNGLNVRYLCPTRPKPRTGRILGYVAQIRIPRAPSPPATPQNRPTSHLDPRTSGHLVEPGGSPAHAQWGPPVGPPGSQGRKKSFFPKLFLDHLGCSNKRFWHVLSLWGRVLGHGKSQNALKMGRFGTKTGAKMGQKRVFRKVIVHHLGCSNKCFEPVLSPW